MSVVIETTIGDITVDLFVDERPISCLNFIKLCKLKYYNYNLFHTIERGFIAQTGDPTGAGNGGTSIWGVLEGNEKRFFEGETLPKIYHRTAGLLSLVSAGKNMVGSQFFLTLAPNLTSLDSMHCVIGEVVEGHDTLRKLNEAIVDEDFRPYQDIRITHTVILEDPFPDPRSFRVPSRSPSPSAERLLNGRIAADEDIEDTDGKTAEELQEILAQREAKARATILEIVGDLPDADMAPPENVLFVCKLNPLTTDYDLEIIFSRFGKVKTCEVIRDKKSGDSLQYAFIEFEEQKSCEAAYFKMDNVLIDDRRIHVDFSQSVAKVKWRGKGRGVEGYLKNSEFDSVREYRVVKGNREKGQPRRSHDREYSNRDRSHSNRESESGERLGSDERRLAREKRHREQHEKERKQRQEEHRTQGHEHKEKYRERTEYTRHDSVNKNQREERKDSARRVERNERERKNSRERYRRSRSNSQQHTRRSSQDRQRRNRSPTGRNRSAERTKRASEERHRDAERVRRSSTERHCVSERTRRSSPQRHRDELRMNRTSPDRQRNGSRYTTEKKYKKTDDDRRTGHHYLEKRKSPESKKKNKSNAKKRKARASSSSNSSSDSESDSSDSSSSSSTTNNSSASSDSSPERKRRKQKPTASKKKSKPKARKSKSKKHK